MINLTEAAEDSTYAHNCTVDGYPWPPDYVLQCLHRRALDWTADLQACFMRLIRVFTILSSLLFPLATGSWSQETQPTTIARNNAGDSLIRPDREKSAAAPINAARPSGASLASPGSNAASIFDTLSNPFATVVTNIEVRASSLHEATAAATEPFQAGGEEIVSSAGTFGDVSRFLQNFPGVVATSDLSNEVLVRGGHPMENLFLVDGIEVPNINHVALAGTTGGFGPMIDSAVIQSVSMYTGAFGAQYPEHLSSVTEIQTLDPRSPQTHAEGDFGIQGFGGLADKNIHGSDLLVSAHRGLLNFMQAAGIGNLPSYTNEFSRLRHNDQAGNRLVLLHVGGWDSVSIDPCENDPYETSSINSRYSGWRETTGVEWQRVYSAHAFGVVEASDSEQAEHIHQQDQMIDPTKFNEVMIQCPIPIAQQRLTPVYMEDSNSAFSKAGYRFDWSASSLSFSAGSSFRLQRPSFNVQQPLGAYSPYSAAAVRSDNTSFTSALSTGESGSFAEFTAHPFKSLALNGGGRLQTFAFGDHITVTPRLSLRYGLGEHVGLHAAFAQYAQMPPFIYLLSYPSNRFLQPMRSTHEIVGMDIGFGPPAEIHIEAYNKIYRDIPSSTEYPSVNLHNIVDLLGQQFVWLPMNSEARGNASGIEISDLTRIGSRLVVRSSVAYSRAKFAGTDHVFRPGNFDIPWIVNIEGLQRLGRGYEISSRYGYATGRPFTPFDAADSVAQNRPIYDVSRMNSQRVPYYGRLDAQINKDMTRHGLHLELYAGVDNLLNRANFLSYVWLPRMDQYLNGRISQSNLPVKEIDQMPIFPNIGVRYIFR